MRRINLLPEALIRERKRRRHVRTAALAVTCILLLALLWGSTAFWQIRKLDTQIAGLEDQVHEFQAHQDEVLSRYEEYQRLRASVDHWQQLALPLPISSLLMVVVDQMPESLALTELYVQPPSPVMSADNETDVAVDPMRMRLRGMAANDAHIARFIGYLTDHELFDQVKLARSQQVAGDDQPRHEFVLTLEVPLNRRFHIDGRGEMAHAR